MATGAPPDEARLRAWLDSLAEDLPRLFQSTSWRLGFGLVRLAKGLLRRDHLPADTYRVSEVLRAYRIWRDGRGLEPREVDLPPAPEPAQVTVLAGDLAAPQARLALSLAEGWSRNAHVQVIGFRFDPTPPPRPGPGQARLDTFPGSCFPAFHRSLAQALVACTGRQLVAAAPDLCSLGLALLANHLGGAPVWSVPPPSGQSAPGARDPSDPRAPGWRLWLAEAERALPPLPAAAAPPSGGMPAVSPLARAFAVRFANFHATGRCDPCAG